MPVLVSLLYCTCLCRTKSPKSKLGKEESALKEPARTLGIALKDLLCMCSSFLLLYLVCFCLSLEWLKRFFHLNILEFAGRGQLDKVWCCTWNAVIYLNYIGQVLFMHVLCLRSSSPSASFSKTREPEDIRASISSAGEALQEEIERQARGNHSVTFSKMFFVQSGLWLSLLHCFYFCRDIPEKFGEEEKVSRKDQRKEKARRRGQTRMSSQECSSHVR